MRTQNALISRILETYKSEGGDGPKSSVGATNRAVKRIVGEYPLASSANVYEVIRCFRLNRRNGMNVETATAQVKIEKLGLPILPGVDEFTEGEIPKAEKPARQAPPISFHRTDDLCELLGKLGLGFTYMQTGGGCEISYRRVGDYLLAVTDEVVSLFDVSEIPADLEGVDDVYWEFIQEERGKAEITFGINPVDYLRNREEEDDEGELDDVIGLDE